MAEDGRPSERTVEKIVSKSVPFTCTVAAYTHQIRSLWLWSPRQPDGLVVTFLEGDEAPKVWQASVELLEGDGQVDSLRLTYTGVDALLVMDGVESVVELRGPAEPLLDLHLDIQVAKSASTFERELRGLIGA